jgi:hypothetical protein
LRVCKALSPKRSILHICREYTGAQRCFYKSIGVGRGTNEAARVRGCTLHTHTTHLVPACPQ